MIPHPARSRPSPRVGCVRPRLQGWSVALLPYPCILGSCWVILAALRTPNTRTHPTRVAIGAPSLPPSRSRGSLAGARPPPPLLRRVRRREWFSCCSWLLLAASRWPAVVAGPARLRSARSLFAFLACVLRASGCLPALVLGAYRFGLPVSRPLSQARSLAGRESFAPAGLPSRAPSPAAALLVGRVGFPPSGRLCPRALLRSSFGTAVCPFGAVFVPLRGVGYFFSLPSPSRVLASLRLRPSVRAGNPRSLAPLLVASRLGSLYLPLRC